MASSIAVASADARIFMLVEASWCSFIVVVIMKNSLHFPPQLPHLGACCVIRGSECVCVILKCGGSGGYEE